MKNKKEIEERLKWEEKRYNDKRYPSNWECMEFKREQREFAILRLSKNLAALEILSWILDIDIKENTEQVKMVLYNKIEQGKNED